MKLMSMILVSAMVTFNSFNLHTSYASEEKQEQKHDKGKEKENDVRRGEEEEEEEGEGRQAQVRPITLDDPWGTLGQLHAEEILLIFEKLPLSGLTKAALLSKSFAEFACEVVHRGWLKTASDKQAVRELIKTQTLEELDEYLQKCEINNRSLQNLDGLMEVFIRVYKNINKSSPNEQYLKLAFAVAILATSIGDINTQIIFLDQILNEFNSLEGSQLYMEIRTQALDEMNMLIKRNNLHQLNNLATTAKEILVRFEKAQSQ